MYISCSQKGGLMQISYFGAYFPIILDYLADGPSILPPLTYAYLNYIHWRGVPSFINNPKRVCGDMNKP